MIGDESTYSSPVLAGPLRQGEILSSIDQHIVRLDGQMRIEIKTHPFVVVLAQDCDLAQDFSARAGDQALAVGQLVPNILLCEVDIAENMKAGRTIARGNDIWKRIVQNKDDRFQYLREIAIAVDGKGDGIPPLLIDFKRAFTLPTEALHVQLQATAHRRAVLKSPFLEHLSSRYAYFISRVALPRDHHQ